MSGTTVDGTGTGGEVTPEGRVRVDEQWLAGADGAAFVEPPLSVVRARRLVLGAGEGSAGGTGDRAGSGTGADGARSDRLPNGSAANGADGAADADVTLEVAGVVGLLTVHADPAHAPLAAAFDDVLGIPLPARLTSTAAEGRRLRWMSPDEWLLSCAPEEAADIERRLRAALGDAPRVAITNVTAAWCTLVLGGGAAREMLARGVPIDVDARAFPPGRIASTLLAKAGATVSNLGDDRYEILCRRSFAEYVARWIGVAARGRVVAVLDGER